MKLRNQPDRLWKPVRVAVRVVAGNCPSCSVINREIALPAAIYRRSNSSVTFRCQVCALQWTVTLANLHRSAVARLARGIPDPLGEIYQLAADQTKFAAENAANRSAAINRQTTRRVIRLPNTAA